MTPNEFKKLFHDKYPIIRTNTKANNLSSRSINFIQRKLQCSLDTRAGKLESLEEIILFLHLNY